MSRRGITPVVAVVLLLMMTVAAAGGAYTFLGDMTEEARQQGQEELDREIALRDLSCQAGGASPEADFFIANVGTVEVDANDMIIYLYNMSDGELLDTNEAVDYGDALTPGETWDGTVDFSGADMTAGRRFRVAFEFVNEQGATVDGTCQAR